MSNYLDDMFTRIKNGENDFVANVMNIVDCSETEARKVLTEYLKHKLAKIDTQIGRVNVVHGIYLEPDVIRNAIAL